MKLIMIAVMTFTFTSMKAQVKTRLTPVNNVFTETVPLRSAAKLSTFNRWLSPDTPRSFRFSRPVLTHLNSPGLVTTQSYWAGAMTTQSLRKGKMGTWYLWDVQGNLRESRFFLDVNRKSRYSFKIVVPRQ